MVRAIISESSECLPIAHSLKICGQDEHHTWCSQISYRLNTKLKVLDIVRQGPLMLSLLFSSNGTRIGASERSTWVLLWNGVGAGGGGLKDRRGRPLVACGDDDASRARLAFRD